ncbi:MAG: hypothetical protein HYX66_02930 [Ignavibacteria bacterium]|nr:hypothetical protein [Ignavibacteria bacterium]
MELQATDKGFLITRMTQLQRDAIVLPATGLMIYNTSAATFQYNIGPPTAPIWVSMLYINIDGGSSSGVFWSLLGNDSVDVVRNFLGTTNDRPLIIKTDSVTRMIFQPTGEINVYAPTFISGSLDLTGDTTSLMMNGQPGAQGSPLVSLGPGRTPFWSTAMNITDTLVTVGASTVFTGQTRFVDTATFDLLPKIPLMFGNILVGDTANLAKPVPPGTEGSLLQIRLGAPTWIAPDQANYWSLSGNAGVALTNFLGTTDANDLRIATNSTLRMTVTAGGVVDIISPTQITGSLSLVSPTSPLILDGNPGQAGQVLVSQGPGATPRYTDTLTLANLTVTGTSLFQDTARFNLLPVFPLDFSNILVGDSNNIARPLIPGADSTFLAIMNGQVLWFDLGILLRNTAWIVGGNVGVSSSVLGNLDTTGIRDLDITAGGRSMIFADGTQYTIDLRGPVNLDGDNISLSLNGDAGVAGQVLISRGAGLTPKYTDTLTLSSLTVTGESRFIDTAEFDLLPKFPLKYGSILVGDSNDLASPVAPGTEGALLQISFGVPTWVSPDQANYWSLAGNAGLGLTDFLGTTDANDLRLATNSALRMTVTAGGIIDIVSPTQITGSLSLIGPTSPLVANGDAGQPNFVLMSQGPGATPQWYNLEPILNLEPWLVGGNDSLSSPILGVTDSLGPIRDVDLRAGGRTMVLYDGTQYKTRQKVTFNLDGSNVPLELNSDPGAAGDVLISRGPGLTPAYTDTLTLSSLTVTGESFFIDTAEFSLLPKMPLQRGYMLVGDSNNLAAPFAPGTEGSVLQISFGEPTWVASDQSNYWSLTGNAGIGAADFLGTLDANDLRIATNSTLRMTVTAGGIVDIVTPTQITGSLSLIGPNSPFVVNGDAGQPNFVLMSQGPGATPVWYDLTPVFTDNDWQVGGNDTVASPILGNLDGAGAIRDVDIYAGGKSMILVDGTNYTIDLKGPVNLDGPNITLSMNGAPGAKYQVLQSEGPGLTPRWTDTLQLGSLTVTGESYFIDTAEFSLLPKMPLQYNYMLVGDSNNLAAPFAPGTEGSVLQISFGAPTWVAADQSSYWALTGNSGIGATDFLGTTDANDLRLATNSTLRMTVTSGGIVDIVSPTQVTGSFSLIGPNSPIVLNGDAGSVGFALISQGPGATPTWFDLSGILNQEDWKVGGNDSVASPILGNLDATGAIRDVDIYAGGTSLILLNGTAKTIDLKGPVNLAGGNIPFSMNGVPGSKYQVLQSEGPGVTPKWTDTLQLSSLTVTGESFFVDTAEFTLLPKMPLQYNYMLVGDSNNLAAPFPPGSEGSILQISFGAPTWVASDQSSYWSLTGNTGIGATDFLGTTDANDLRLATNNTLRLTVGATTGDVTVANLSGPPSLTPLGVNDGIVVADNAGTFTKRDKSLFLSELGVARGRYENTGTTAQYNVVITTPVGFTLDAQAAIIVTPEASQSVSITPFIVAGSRTANSFTINFPGGLNPGEAINWLVMSP